ncbi:lyase family protein [Ottowia thiooxydans]|uniref:Adenylosuccinate lyase n=1 Tax=Ottowia thiooxydans TaxID=219182 RepID=A0ABV2Q8T3_9BURK
MICLSDDAASSTEGFAVRNVFSAEASVLRILQFEAALARVQARRELIPKAAAKDIADKASLEHFPSESWKEKRKTLGHPLVSVLEAWSASLQPGSREWLHYGATTADVFNTVLIQQLQEAGAALLSQMGSVETRLAKLCDQYSATPMVARTLGRHAQPITFGFKVATWLAEHRRSMERLAHWLERYCTGILSGAVGTYAAFGDEGPDIEREVMAELGLDAPEAVDWKGSRDRFAEFGCVLALAARGCGHMGQEVFLACGDDIGELGESTKAVGSSTMPHKVNPSLSIAVVSLSREVGAYVAPLMEWIPITYDRDSSQHGEVLRDMCGKMADLLSALDQLLACMVVSPQAMQDNLLRSGGMILSEALTFSLAKHMGKRSAYALMKRAANLARDSRNTMKDVLRQSDELRPLLAEHPELLDETHHVGLASAIARAAAGVKSS